MACFGLHILYVLLLGMCVFRYKYAAFYPFAFRFPLGRLMLDGF